MCQSLTAGRRWGAKTSAERRSDRRIAFIGAAIATYGLAGFRNSSVKSVCVAAGLTERYFYESFKDSEDLLQACFTEVTNELTAKLRSAAIGVTGPAADRIRASLVVYFAELRSSPEASRLFLLEMGGISSSTDAIKASSLDAFGRLLLEAYQIDPAAADAPSPLLLRGIVGGGLHIAQAWIASGYATPVSDVIDAALSIYSLVERSPDVQLLAHDQSATCVRYPNGTSAL